MSSVSTPMDWLSVLPMATPNKRLQPTLGNPRAAEAQRWASE
jgi:hypothetical protein